MSHCGITPERKAAILSLLDDPSPTVSAALIKEIREHDEAGVALLREAVESGTPAQRQVAQQWLQALVGKSSTESFMDFIQSFQYDLETGCLLLDRTVFEGLDHEAYYRSIQEMAGRCRELMLEPASAYAHCRVLNRVLFNEYAFQCDSESHDNAFNSYLHQVILRRRGNPLTLSILYLLVADRCGLQLEPIALPGHFLIGCFTDAEPFFIDLLARGTVRTLEDVEAYLLEHHIQPRPEHFKPATTGEVLCRCCRNLVSQYTRENDHERAAYFKSLVRAFEQAYRNAPND